MPPELRPPSLSREAETDIDAAVDWYISENAFTAANDFLDEIEQAKSLLSMFSKVGETGMHNTRMLPLHKFPYSLIYRLQDDVVRIIAIAHHSRRPGYWSRRARLAQESFNPRSPRRTSATRLLDTDASRWICFNPRSPRRTSATVDDDRISRRKRFQSSLAPKDERYSAQKWNSITPCCFNPRSPRRTSATALFFLLTLAFSQFQSSLAPKDERYFGFALTQAGAALFQSSLAPKDERYSVTRFWDGYEWVSILARPEGRALPLIGLMKYCDEVVSILARPEGRALQVLRGIMIFSRSFQSSLAPKDERYLSLMKFVSDFLQFQSSLAPKDERYSVWALLKRGFYGFNPRSPRRTSATKHIKPNGARLLVSILARPEGRALRKLITLSNSGERVSILARPEGRALPRQHAARRIDRIVSILARPEGRALL